MTRRTPAREDHLFLPLVRVAAYRAAQAVGVAVRVLGRAQQRQIGAEVERLLQGAGGKGVVDHHRRTHRVRGVGQGAQVEHLEQRVGGRFQPDQGRLQLADARVLRRIGEVGILDAHAELAQHPLEQPVGAAVDVLFGKDDIARLQAGDDGGDRRDAAGEDRAVTGVLQAGEGGLQVAEVRAARTGVVKGPRIARLKGRRHVDRRDHRAGLGAVVLAEVDRARLKTRVGRHRGIVFHGAGGKGGGLT